MKCAQCQFENPAGMKFCGECGGKLAAVCPQCGVEAPPGFKFCGACGAALAGAPAPPAAPVAEPERLQKLPSAPAAPTVQSYTPAHLAGQVLQSKSALEGERKQVTVLFCDLVSSTAMADRIGPEAMHLLLNRFFEMALGEIHRFEGTINQFLGDGFMALFGAPIAHEDHARRSVLAALGLQKQLAERSGELGEVDGVELKIRMGINTGWVVVGGIGDNLRMDYTAVGDTTNLAARLQQHSEPGWILISESTSRMVANEVRLEAMPPFLVKGKQEPIQAFRVLGFGTQTGEQPVPAASQSPFVGRRRELEVLDELLKQAAGGEGHVVGIAGEAGSGKSRLLQELRRRSWSASTMVLGGRCLSYGSGVPYLPLLYMLRHNWGIGENDSAGAITEKVAASLGRAGLEVTERMPYLLHLLGVKEGAEPLADLSPQAVQARTFNILRQMILNLAQDRLVILEIEDLHWVDKASEDFLAYLIEGMAAARLLILLTYRSGYLPRWLEKSYATQITMRRLSAQDSQAVVDSVLQRTKLPEDFARMIVDKAEGNPFFLEELTRSLVEHKTGELAVPDTIHGVLMARIDRLPEEHKRLLQTASVLGREFSLDLLQAIWERPEKAPLLLADLKHWEFLYEAPAAEKPTYFFKHALTQETVYQSLLSSRRQALHLAAGRALEALYADRLQDVYDGLIHHYPKAGEHEKAITYLSLFAAGAAQSFTHTEAAKALREALTHAEQLAGAQRDRRVVELLLQLVESLFPLTGFGETLELLHRYAPVLERLGDPALAGRYHFWLAHTYSYIGKQDEAESSARKAIEAARQAGDQVTEGKAYYVMSRDGFWSGRFADGVRHSLQAIALLDRGETRWWQGQAYWVVGFNYYAQGRFQEALAAMDRVRDIRLALGGDPRLDASWSVGYFLASMGEGDRAIEENRAAVERAQDPLNTAVALGFLGHAHLEKRDLPQAIETLSEAVEQMRQAGMPQLLGWFSSFLGEALLLSGRIDEARDAAIAAVEVTREARFWYGIALAERTAGRVALAAGDLDEAERRFEAARSGFLALEMPFELARADLDFVGLACARGNTEEGARVISAVHRTFSELGVPRYVKEAERRAAELGLPVNGNGVAVSGPDAAAAGVG